MFSSKVIVVLIILLNIMFSTCVISARNSPCQPGTPSAPKKTTGCPRDTLKFGVCGDWLGLVHEVIGAKPSSKCCTLLEGLANVEAAMCLCTAINANVLGISNLKIPVALSMVIDSCGKRVPKGFVCK